MRRVATIIGLCVLAVACNLVGPGIFWDVIGTGGFMQHLAFVASGALVAEGCLLGIWCGLSQQPIKYRLPVTVTLVLTLACSYSLGLQLPDSGSPDQGMPVEVALVITGAGLGLFAVLQVPLWLIRRSTRCRIARPETVQFESSLKGMQFSVGYLMLWTALVGVVLVLVRNSLPDHSDGVAVRELMEIGMLILVYIGLSSLLSIPCVWIALTERPLASASLLLAGALIAGPFLVLVCTNMIFGKQNAGEILSGVACYEVGLTGTTLAVLLVLRSFGYRVLVVASQSILGSPNLQLDELLVD